MFERLILLFSLKRQLQIIVALSLAAVLALAGSSAYFASRTKTAAHVLLDKGVVGTRWISDLQILLQQHQSAVMSASADLDPWRVASAKAAVLALSQRIKDIYPAGPVDVTTHDQSSALATTLNERLPAMLEAGTQAVSLAGVQAQSEALWDEQSRFMSLASPVLSTVTRLLDLQGQGVERQVSSLSEGSDSLVRWAYAGAATAVVIGVLGIAIVQGMLRRLWQVRRSMLRLADHDSSVEVPCLADQDEIGAMARAVQVFKNNALQVLSRDAELRYANVRFEAALSNMSQGLCLYDSENRLDVVNKQFCSFYNIDVDQIRPGLTFRQVYQLSVDAGNYPGADIDDLIGKRQAFVDKREPGSTVQELGNGRLISIMHRPLPNGGWVATYDDITDRRAAEAKISYMARHDALTALPNRLVLSERIEQALADAGRGGKSAVLCLDIDHFKRVNDTFGHPVGDSLLRAVAERLLACVREGDTVARLGSDEFAVVQTGIARPEDAKLMAERLIAAIRMPFTVDGHHVAVSISIGLALVPEDGTNSATLLKNADMALCRAKSEQRGTFCFFETDMDARLQRRRQLELDLLKGLANHEFELFYQPLVVLATEQVGGFEALLRWWHPERGLVSPGEFIPIAEEIGLIIPLGEWVIEQACAEAVSWPDGIKVAVNLSPSQFRSKNLVPTVANALAKSGLPANRLELEVTETLLLQDSESTLAMLHEFRALGVRISMDDFGTGYSSLSYLRSFPFDKIKIDQSFIRDLSHREEAIHIVRAINGLCAGLAMTTTAEGVETEEELAKLRAEGCTEVQGYLFSPPRPASEVQAILNRVRQRAEQAAGRYPKLVALASAS